MKKSYQLGLLAGFLVLIGLYFSFDHQENNIRPVNGSREDYRDMFFRSDVYIAAGQTVGRLLVVDGNALIEGRVGRGIVISGGSLTATSSARIDGPVIVLGGQVFREPAAVVTGTGWVLASKYFPGTGWVVGLVLAGGWLGIVLAGLLIWQLVDKFKKLPVYSAFTDEVESIQERWPGLYIGLALFFSAMLLTLFLELAWKTLFRNSLEFVDKLITWLVRYYATPTVDRVMIYLTSLGSGRIYAVFGLISLVGLFWRRLWREGVILAVCLTGGGFLNYVLKSIFERSRPDLFRLVPETGYSFPSGHAMVALCFYGMLAYLVMRRTSSGRKRLLVAVLTAALLAAIGLSRIYLGVHYPTDVAAGYIAGGVWLGLCISLLIWWEKKVAG